MPVNLLNGLVVIDTDMVRLDAHHGSQLLMQLVHRGIPVTAAGDEQQPQVGELGGERRGDVPQVSVRHQVREYVVGDKAHGDHEGRPRGEEEVENRHPFAQVCLVSC
jgi:hypothetical protein